jgi:hypothetical protein
MGEDLAAVEQAGKVCVVVAQVIDPHRGVDQDQCSADRRRGTDVSSGSVSPRRARRRALSRSISAVSPSRTSSVFSFIPDVKHA